MPDTAARLKADPAQSARLALEQLRLALRNLRPNSWLMPLLAATMCFMFARWVSTPVLITWFALVTVSGACLGIVAEIFLRRKEDAPSSGAWVRNATSAYFLFAASWSAFGFLFWRQGDDLNHMLIMLVIGCTIAGNSALVGASKPLIIVGFAVHGLVFVLAPLREGGALYDGLALMAFGYVCFLAWMSRQIYFTARDMLLLRDDKNDLIDALAQSKADSDLARDRAESANRAKSKFLANMSHELRTPLNAILGFSEMIYSIPAGAPAVRSQEYAKLVHQSGSHLLALIDDILDLAKIEAGKFELRECDVDLACLIGDAVQLMAPKAELANLALATEVAAELPVLHVDQRAIWQILLNLLANAVKFTPAGGSIYVFARTEASGEIAFGVRDTGVGIAPEDQLQVFETFGQGRHYVAMPDKGTGLGLSIVKGIAEAHGGRVELASHLGRGTCVTIVLPASRAKPRLKQAS